MRARLWAVLGFALANAGQAAPTTSLEEITVYSTPLGGLELPSDRVPGNVQQASSSQIEAVRRGGLAQFLDQRVGSISINEAQASLLQPDVYFRGFTASPLLGQPQGIAVYQNGVRINDPFGDIVQWALVPEGAIAGVELIPGSNPVFGLNTLGGALALRTKNGVTNPGTGAEAMFGSFGRTVAALESGGELDDRFSYYGNVRHLDEEGWRDHSPSAALHLFGDLGWRGANSSANLNLTRIETDLIGNGPAPVQLLELDREAIYTHPDRTRNSLTFVTLSSQHRANREIELRGAIYLRRSDVDTVNGDESPFDECAFDDELVCDDAGELAHDLDGEPIESDPAVDGAALNRGLTTQDTYGVSTQLGTTAPVGGRDNRFIIGGSFDHSDVRFRSDTELASFDEGRGAIGSGIRVDEPRVALATQIDNLGFFVTDTFSPTARLDLTVAGRYNDTHIRLRDGLGTALNGEHRFSRFNGAAGLTYRPNSRLTLYASYSESNRAPSPVELTCADEQAPCALPNAFLSDPPLEQVIARTVEGGARGAVGGMQWHAGAFRTDNDDDIVFISAGALTNRGFFENVGATRRQGLELNLHGKLGPAAWFASYTYLQAQFRDSLRVSSPHNPAAIDGEIDVRSGARIPSIPEHMLKAGASIALTRKLSVEIDAVYQSNRHLRGDEANLTAPLPGYTVVNVAAEFAVNDKLTLFAQAANLLDREYETFGLYGAADDVLGEDGFDDPRFVSPAAPRSVWVGIRWSR